MTYLLMLAPVLGILLFAGLFVEFMLSLAFTAKDLVDDRLKNKPAARHHHWPPHGAALAR